MGINYEQAKQCIQKSNNIYDIYINIYEILRKNISDLQTALEDEYPEDIRWKTLLNDIWDSADFGIDISAKYKKMLIDTIPEHNQHEMLVFLKLLFDEIDRSAGDRNYRTSKDYIEDDGKPIALNCLNSGHTLPIGQVYYRNKNFWDNILKDDSRFKLDREKGETIEKYQKNLLVKIYPGSDTKTTLFKITDKYINGMIKYRKNNFKIALVPITDNKEILKINYINRADGKHFVVEGINDEDKYVELVENILKNLVQENVDIVIFPEMTFTERMIQKTREIIYKNRGKFIMVVCGTVWSNRRNICITIGGNGREIGRQFKLNRYKANDGSLEDLLLDSQDKIINIYDLEGFGRFCTPICVDFITAEYFTSISNMGVNISLIPTYTSSLSDFEQKARDLGSKNMGSVFLTNSCGSIEKEKIAFAYAPKKGVSMLPAICKNKNTDRCKSGLCMKYFITDISENGNIKLDLK